MTICKIEQQEAGGPYPRTCPTCRLGRCHFGRDNIGRREHAEALVAELEGLRARLADLTDAAQTILDHGTIWRDRHRRDREFQAPLWTRERLAQALKETTHD